MIDLSTILHFTLPALAGLVLLLQRCHERKTNLVEPSWQPLVRLFEELPERIAVSQHPCARNLQSKIALRMDVILALAMRQQMDVLNPDVFDELCQSLGLDPILIRETLEPLPAGADAWAYWLTYGCPPSKGGRPVSPLPVGTYTEFMERQLPA